LATSETRLPFSLTPSRDSSKLTSKASNPIFRQSEQGLFSGIHLKPKKINQSAHFGLLCQVNFTCLPPDVVTNVSL
jgi:hypothetical protein